MRWLDRLRAARLGSRARLIGAPVFAGEGRIEVGDDLVLSSVPVRTHVMAGPGARVRIGRRARISHGVGIHARVEITIGDDVVIGPFAMILDADFHEVRDRHAAGTPKPVRIGDGVRIGACVVVLRGAIIGDGAEIAPGSVVSRAIPPGARAAGVPARPVG